MPMFSDNKNLELYALALAAEGMAEESIRYHVKLAETASLAWHPEWQLRQRIEDIVAGKIKRVHWPWHYLDQQCPTLMPGQITVIAGAPGATKSFALLQCLDYWVSSDVPVAMMALEGKRSSHLTRLLAQLEGNTDIMDAAWVADHADQVRAAMDRHSDRIESVGQCICVPDVMRSSSVTYSDVLSWMWGRARVGDRVLIVDPITSADPIVRQWEADRELLNQCIRLADTHKLSIILVTHPAKMQSSSPSLDSMALGASYQRHVDGVIWLAAHDKKKRTVLGPCGRTEIDSNRVMYLLKVRDGKGQGKAIAYTFGAETLKLSEGGIIIKEPKQ
jgi:KaiC/GvpD/RAD55 family RecA-like ATPase